MQQFVSSLRSSDIYPRLSLNYPTGTKTAPILGSTTKIMLNMFDNGLIIINRKMKVLNKSNECQKCARVDSIVKVNELMIQQQIKIIKGLHLEKDQLQSNYRNLQQQYQLICKRISKQESQRVMVQTKQQQTQPYILELKKSNSLSSNSQSSSRDKVTDKPDKENPQIKVKRTTINKENIEQHIPIVMIRKDEEYFSRKRKNSYQEQNMSKEWLKTMEAMGPVTTFKFKQKTLPFVKKGIPHQLRHVVWPIVVDNQMALTDQLYFQLLQRRNQNWMPEEVKNQISKDICRSFSGRTQYQSKIGLREEVTEVLELFHLYRPDVSYIQGMTYPVIVLTIIVGKVKAFNIFSNMVLANPFFKRLFTFQANFIQVLGKSFDYLLFEYNEDVAMNLRAKNIDSQTFLVEWFFTVFSRSLSFQGTLKFWDYLLYVGEVALFRLALAIMDLVGPRIIENNYEETIGLIQGFGGFGKEKKLIDSISQNKLTSEKLHKTIERMQRLYEKGDTTN